MNYQFLQYLDTIFRLIIFLELISGLGVWLYWALRHKEKYKYSVAPVLYVCHALIFIGASGLGLLPQIIYVLWRDILFIHGLLILNLVGIVFIQLWKGNK